VCFVSNSLLTADAVKIGEAAERHHLVREGAEEEAIGQEIKAL
jgi:hypothetical protein